ncbi:MAG TPA: hypothetical protein VF598_12435 [Hymenobacter sp.]
MKRFSYFLYALAVSTLLLTDCDSKPADSSTAAATETKADSHIDHGDMAQAELRHGKDARLKGMAQKIVDAQKREREQFEAWRARNADKMKPVGSSRTTPTAFNPTQPTL